MSTNVPGFQSFFSFFASFIIGIISHQQHIKGSRLYRRRFPWSSHTTLVNLIASQTQQVLIKLALNPSNADATFIQSTDEKDFENHLNPVVLVFIG